MLRPAMGEGLRASRTTVSTASRKEHMTDTTTPQSTDETPVDPVERVLARAEARSGVRVSTFTDRDGARSLGAAQALQDSATIARPESDADSFDGRQWDREERAAL